jgi:hypothetical protein
MKTILLSLGILMFLFVLITVALITINHDTYIIGGNYIVPEGEVIHGNLGMFFAQVKLEKGARVEGALISFSSTLDLCGKVTGHITSLESEVTVQQSAQVKESPKDSGIFPFVVILPEMARWNLSIGG